MIKKFKRGAVERARPLFSRFKVLRKKKKIKCRIAFVGATTE